MVAETVKCADCGYLAFRHRETRQLVEAELELRERGGIAPSAGKVPDLSGYPLCFANAADLRSEYSLVTSEGMAPEPDSATYAELLYRGEESQKVGGVATDNEFLLRWKVMHRERVCSAFAPWQQGFTPKEHREMVDRLKLQEWQERQQQVERDWQSDRRRKDEAWRSGERKWRWVELVILIVGAGLFTLLGAYIQRNDNTPPVPVIVPAPAVNVSPVFVIPTPSP